MNVHIYGQLQIEEDGTRYHVYHQGRRLNDKYILDLNRAYQWCRDNHPELTVNPPEPKRARWEEEDYINYYAGGQP